MQAFNADESKKITQRAKPQSPNIQKSLETQARNTQLTIIKTTSSEAKLVKIQETITEDQY